MRNRTVLLVAVLLLSAVGGPVAGLVGAQQDQVTITILVRTAAGGALGNADVHVSWDGGSAPVETTKSNGEALVDVPAGADLTIEIDHQFYVRNTVYTVTDAQETTYEVTVWRKASATVTVVDADGPVQNARVVFRKSGDIVGVHSTNARGIVESGIIEAGEYTVSFFKPGYLREAVPLTIDEQGITEEVTIEQSSVTAQFRVIDDHFDPPQPVGQVEISGPGFSTTTQPDGRAGAVVPVNTEITVTVEREGYQTLTRTLVIREDDLQINFTTSRREAIKLDVPNERVVVGESVQLTVTDEYDEPRPDATVYLDGDPVGQPNAQGVIRVPIDSEGDHTLFAQVDQLTSDRLTVTGVRTGDGTAPTPAVEERVVQPSGFLALPGLGLIHLRSVAIGTAGGVVLAAFLFLYVRLG